MFIVMACVCVCVRALSGGEGVSERDRKIIRSQIHLQGTGRYLCLGNQPCQVNTNIQFACASL